MIYQWFEALQKPNQKKKNWMKSIFLKQIAKSEKNK